MMRKGNCFVWRGLERPIGKKMIFTNDYTNISGEPELANHTMKNETERICLIKPTKCRFECRFILKQCRQNDILNKN